ncbi:MAG TPA: hypothetical protein VJU86_10930 [Pyrinomonadaceae bacterium]|nr:hypothetical protein [Pyrinomonadaceae bacterium]
MKARILGVVLIIVFSVLLYINWQQLLRDGTYSLKMAAFTPVGIVGGLFLLFFPSMVGAPKTTKEKVIVMAVFVVGLIAGLINWYLMDPGFFGM